MAISAAGIEQGPRTSIQRKPEAMPDTVVILVVLAAVFLALGTTWRL
jgi:hypothetical protein